jgi:hypothetical protein
MSEKDYSLVTAKAGSVVAENLRLSLATPAGSITPATLTAMVGIAKGEALTLAPTVKNAMEKLEFHANLTSNTQPGWIEGISGNTGSANTALTNLTSLQSSLGVTGTPASSNLGNFGSIISQAQGHIQDATEIKSVQNFLSDSKFSDFGSGITSMSTLTTRGLDAQFGSLSAAASAMTAAGPCFNMANPSSIGSAAGLVDKLKSSKLGNFSGLNQALAANGVDLDNMDDPVYSETITKTLSSISDPKILKDVIGQLGINPPGGISSDKTQRGPSEALSLPSAPLSVNGIKNLNDLTDITKLAGPSSVAGLTGGLSGIATKFSDLGASFPSPSAAAEMLKNIEVPSIPKLNSAASDLSSFTAGLAPNIKILTGSGVGVSALTGADDLPSISDFTHAVSGGPELAALAAAGGNITEAQIAALENSVTKSKNLLGKAGVDLSSLPGTNLATSLTFATSLHKYGATSIGSAIPSGMSEITGSGGVADILKNIARPGSEYGDAIKASLAEGKNKALMIANGIKPPNFGETPFKNLPSAGSINSLGSPGSLLSGS